MKQTLRANLCLTRAMLRAAFLGAEGLQLIAGLALLATIFGGVITAQVDHPSIPLFRWLIGCCFGGLIAMMSDMFIRHRVPRTGLRSAPQRHVPTWPFRPTQWRLTMSITLWIGTTLLFIAATWGLALLRTHVVNKAPDIPLFAPFPATLILSGQMLAMALWMTLLGHLLPEPLFVDTPSGRRMGALFGGFLIGAGLLFVSTVPIDVVLMTLEQLPAKIPEMASEFSPLMAISALTIFAGVVILFTHEVGSRHAHPLRPRPHWLKTVSLLLSIPLLPIGVRLLLDGLGLYLPVSREIMTRGTFFIGYFLCTLSLFVAHLSSRPVHSAMANTLPIDHHRFLERGVIWTLSMAAICLLVALGSMHLLRGMIGAWLPHSWLECVLITLCSGTLALNYHFYQRSTILVLTDDTPLYGFVLLPWIGISSLGLIFVVIDFPTHDFHFASRACVPLAIALISWLLLHRALATSDLKSKDTMVLL